MTAYSFRLKAVLAAGLVAAADLLLFDHEIGANLGLLMLAALAVAVHMGLHVKIAAMLIESYAALPPGRLPDPALVRAWGLSGIRDTFMLAFSIAMPFVLAGLIYNVALGAINRAMPQLMVSFVGAPALTFGGLVLLAVALPTGVVLWLGHFDQFLAAPFRVLP